MLKNREFWPAFILNFIGILLGGLISTYWVMMSIGTVEVDEGESWSQKLSGLVGHIFGGLLDGRWMVALVFLALLSSLIAVAPVRFRRKGVKPLAILLSIGVVIGSIPLTFAMYKWFPGIPAATPLPLILLSAVLVTGWRCFQRMETEIEEDPAW